MDWGCQVVIVSKYAMVAPCAGLACLEAFPSGPGQFMLVVPFLQCIGDKTMHLGLLSWGHMA